MTAPTDKQWAEHWRRVGPQLAEIRRQELREYNYAENLAAIDALLDIGFRFGTPRLTSGLVEWHRKLARGRR